MPVIEYRAQTAPFLKYRNPTFFLNYADYRRTVFVPGTTIGTRRPFFSFL